MHPQRLAEIGEKKKTTKQETRRNRKAKGYNECRKGGRELHSPNMLMYCLIITLSKTFDSHLQFNSYFCVLVVIAVAAFVVIGMGGLTFGEAFFFFHI